MSRAPTGSKTKSRKTGVNVIELREDPALQELEEKATTEAKKIDSSIDAVTLRLTQDDQVRFAIEGGSFGIGDKKTPRGRWPARRARLGLRAAADSLRRATDGGQIGVAAAGTARAARCFGLSAVPSGF